MSELRGPRLVCLLTLAVPAVALVYPDGPPIEHTGGFGEPTCHACHFDGPLNGPDSRLILKGQPEVYEPDSAYVLTIVVSKTGLGAGGFMLSSRFGDGLQAGNLSPSDDRSTLKSNGAGVQYAMHTLDGVDPTARDSASWTIHWTAPSQADTVRFHLAANAANGDDSEFGDAISAAEFVILPTRP